MGFIDLKEFICFQDSGSKTYVYEINAKLIHHYFFATDNKSRFSSKFFLSCMLGVP